MMLTNRLTPFSSFLIRKHRTFVHTAGRCNSNMVGYNDITGTITTTNDKKLLSYLDDSIMGLITKSTNANYILKNIIQENKECGLAHILLALNLNRCTLNSYSDITVDDCLNNIDRLGRDNKLNNRERYMGAAALAWHEGSYLKAGSLLESCLNEFPHDAITLRFAQDAYRCGGNNVYVLSCIARNCNHFANDHILHGYVLGMLSAGCIENGRLNEAEEYASRAVSITKGQDYWSLHALLNIFLLSGRTSEVLAEIGKYEDKLDGEGMFLLLYNKGSSHVSRGNYSAAIKVFDQMLSAVKTTDHIIPSSAILPTLLLWNISLNVSNESIDERWVSNELHAIWNYLLSNGKSDPFLDIAATMAFECGSAIVNAKKSATDAAPWNQDTKYDNLTPLEVTHVKAPSMFKWMGFGSRGDSNDTVVDTKKKSSEEMHDIEAIKRWEDVKSNLKCVTVLLQEHRINMTRRAAVAPTSTSSYQYLENVRVNNDLIYDRYGADKNEQVELTRNKSIPISRAIAYFVDKKYSESADVLMELYHDRDITALHSDILCQTLVEALMRSNRAVEAQMILSERTVTNPNDAQSWRRLTALYGQLGRHDMAQIAHYTAYQLGIDQGGFGGNR